jgi:hypothetical protein
LHNIIAHSGLFSGALLIKMVFLGKTPTGEIAKERGEPNPATFL